MERRSQMQGYGIFAKVQTKNYRLGLTGFTGLCRQNKSLTKNFVTKPLLACLTGHIVHNCLKLTAMIWIMNKKTQTFLLLVAFSNAFIFADKAANPKKANDPANTGNAADFIAKHDKNGDGQLILEEFTAPSSDDKANGEATTKDKFTTDQNFLRIDANHNGVITKEEIEAYFESLKKKSKKSGGKHRGRHR